MPPKKTKTGLRPEPSPLQKHFKALVALATSTNGGARGQVFITCDLLRQDALFDVQEKFSNILLEMAKDLGPEAQAELVKMMPALFQVQEEQSVD